MRQSLFILLAALIAFWACQEITIDLTKESNTYSLSELQFNLTIERGTGTKGVRQSWQDGDVVFIFFENVSDAYLTVTYHSSTGLWDATPTSVGNSSSVAGLAASGILTAVYLPYGNSLAPTWDPTSSSWVFSDTNPIDYYYLKSEKSLYFITDTNDVLPTLGAYLYMETAAGFVQFYLPDDNASGTIQMACSALLPAGIAGVSLDGTVNETVGTQGDWITARAETYPDGNVQETGYYATGKLSSRPGVLYYFAIDKGAGSGDDRYMHYFKQRATAIEARGAYQLPSLSTWLTVSPTTFVTIAGIGWYTTNMGAATPWDLGTETLSASLASLNLATGTAVPSDAQWEVLLDRIKTAWIQTSILGRPGFLVMDRTSPENFFFLPGVDYWSTTASHYFHTADDGTHTLVETNPPASAFIRLYSTLYGGNFNPPENGGDI